MSEILYKNPSRPPRQSNVELLRIVATFLILTVHADFFSIGAPTVEDMDSQPIESCGQLLFQALSVVAVNVFVLISGWFGIRTTLSGVLKLLFQCTFFGALMYAVAVALGKASLSGGGLLSVVISNNNWFVVGYIGLMVLAPMLNAFVAAASRRQFELVLIAFFVFQTVYGTFVPLGNPIVKGYSTFSFIGLYLLARYINIYKSNICNRGGYCVALYAGCAILNVLLYIATKRWLPQLEMLFGVNSYINPLNIIGACGLTFAFVGMKMPFNRMINFISASAFAAFLLHFSQCQLYKELMRGLYARYPGAGYVFAAGIVILAIFAIAVLLDQPRKALWKVIRRQFPTD